MQKENEMLLYFQEVFYDGYFIEQAAKDFPLRERVRNQAAYALNLSAVYIGEQNVRETVEMRWIPLQR